jgi:hypothetical protein
MTSARGFVNAGRRVLNAVSSSLHRYMSDGVRRYAPANNARHSAV